MYHPPAVSGADVVNDKRHRKQPPKQVWLDAIMSKTRSTEPSPSHANSSSSNSHTPLASHAHAHSHQSSHKPTRMPMPAEDGTPWQNMDAIGGGTSTAAALPLAPGGAPPLLAAPQRSSRTPSPVVTATALHTLPLEATPSAAAPPPPPPSVQAAEPSYVDQLRLEHHALEAAVLKALKELVADTDCCFIARGVCHLCHPPIPNGTSNGTNGRNLVPVVNFCPDFTPTHSLCREHLRSMHRVRLEDIFAGKNQPTVSKRALRCSVCALSCPCATCQLTRDAEIAKYKQWLSHTAIPTAAPTATPATAATADVTDTVEMPRASDSEMRSSRTTTVHRGPRSRDRTPPPLPPPSAISASSALPVMMSDGDGVLPTHVDDRWSDNAQDKQRTVDGRRPQHHAEDKLVEADAYGYDDTGSTGPPPPPAWLRADDKKPPRSNSSRVPKRAAKESVSYPVVDTSNATSGSGYISRGAPPRERLLGGEPDEATVSRPVMQVAASPSAASVLNCPDSEKSLVDLLSSLNQQITPAVRFFAEEDGDGDEDAPSPRTASTTGGETARDNKTLRAARNDDGAAATGVQTAQRGANTGFENTYDEVELRLRRQKRKREAATGSESSVTGSRSADGSTRKPANDRSHNNQHDNGDSSSSSSYRQKAPTPLTTVDKKAKPAMASAPTTGLNQPPSPSPRGRASARAKGSASAGPLSAAEPKVSSRKRDAPSEPIPTPPASARKRKTEAAQSTPTPSPGLDRKSSSRGPEHRGHAHKPVKAPQTSPASADRRRGRKKNKKSSRNSDDSDEEMSYSPDEDVDNVEEEDGTAGEQNDGDDDSELDTNLDYCEVCLAAGDLVCCDVCPRSFHLNCLKMTEGDLPEGDWQCAECRKPSYFESFAVSVAEKTTVPAKCLQIVQCLMSHPFAKQFLLPVENVPHYTAIVKQPMDLTTIEKKIQEGKYLVSGSGSGNSAGKVLHLGSFAEDVRLVWGNCKLFNDDGSGITRAADHLSKGFERLYQHVLRCVERASSKSPSSGQPSRVEKKPFGQVRDQGERDPKAVSGSGGVVAPAPPAVKSMGAATAVKQVTKPAESLKDSAREKSLPKATATTASVVSAKPAQPGASVSGAKGNATAVVPSTNGPAPVIDTTGKSKSATAPAPSGTMKSSASANVVASTPLPSETIVAIDKPTATASASTAVASPTMGPTSAATPQPSMATSTSGSTSGSAVPAGDSVSAAKDKHSGVMATATDIPAKESGVVAPPIAKETAKDPTKESVV